MSRENAAVSRTPGQGITRRRFMATSAAVVALALGETRAVIGQSPATPAPTNGVARNVIFLLGDGMGVAQRFAGQLSQVGPYTRLRMDSLPVVGIVETTAADPESVVTDSAAGATSYATGVKTFNGAIGVDADGNPVPTVLELAKAAGKSVGLVTTSQVTDASPAAFGAHVPDRGDQSEIARQYIEETGVDVILGGGEDRWLPEGTPGAYPDNPPEDPEAQSQSDTGDLVARAQDLGYEYVSDAEGLMAATGPKLLGLFANEEMFASRPEGEGDRYEPAVTLEQMTAKAIELLSQNPNGFFLFVEEEAIDEMAHDNNGALMLRAVGELDRAVGVALDFLASVPDTLILVTGDHETGGLAVEELDNPEFPDESGIRLGGTAGLSGEDGPFPVANADYAFILDWTTTGHTGASLPLTAAGAGSERLAGMYQNTDVFTAVVEAMGLEVPQGAPATPAG